MALSEVLPTEPPNPFVTWITAPGRCLLYAPRHDGSDIHRLRGDQHMKNDRELNIDELSTVHGGMANTGNGSLPHPKPPLVDQIIKWIISHL
jgi:hypothetical protein